MIDDELHDAIFPLVAGNDKMVEVLFEPDEKELAEVEELDADADEVKEAVVE